MNRAVAPRVSERRRVRVLLPVWNQQYINAFLRFGLPTLLAQGNLPALAAACDVEFVFLSRIRDRADIYSSSLVSQLRRTVRAVEFIEIDDLIRNSNLNLYGYTLTFAFMRGIQAAGHEMTNTHFIFLVSDFVYADGALKSLVRHINEGRRVVLSASLRVRRYEAGLALSNPRYRQDACVVVPPREMMRIALRNLHPSLLGKVVNLPIFYSRSCQHFFWQVDGDTLIGRNFLAHMLCLKPERYISEAHGFCDYTFIPELCPSLDVAFLADSDDFAVIELQSPEHEIGYVKLGRRDVPNIITDLAKWTTREHRIFAEQSFLFHAREVPATVSICEAEAESFIRQILNGLLSVKPVPAIDHPHWHSNIEIFRKTAAALDERQIVHGRRFKPRPFDLFTPPLPRGRVERVRFAVRRFAAWLAFGTPPFVRRWHPNWAEYQPVRRELPHLLKQAKHTLVVADPWSPLNRYLGKTRGSLSLLTLSELRDHVPVLDHDTSGFDGLFMILSEYDVCDLSTLLDRLRRLLTTGASVLIFMAHKSHSGHINLPMHIADFYAIRAYEVEEFSACSAYRPIGLHEFKQLIGTARFNLKDLVGIFCIFFGMLIVGLPPAGRPERLTEDRVSSFFMRLRPRAITKSADIVGSVKAGHSTNIQACGPSA